MKNLSIPEKFKRCLVSLIIKLMPDIAIKLQYYDTKHSIVDISGDNNDIIIDNLENIKEVYSYLADEKSRQVFTSVIKAHLYKSFTKKYNEYEKIKEKCDWVDNEISFTLDNGQIMQMYHDERQYDPRDLENIIKYSDNETFLDIGAYDGCTIWQFHKIFKGKYKNIISFEPSKFNYKAILNMIKDIHDEKIIVHNCGLAAKACTKYFPKTLDPNCSGYTENREDLEACEFKNVYDVLTKEQQDSVSVIKMDIEGAEMEVLQSLEKIIVKNKPKLILSAYHKVEDIFVLPMYIHKLLPNHKLYLRHHTNWRFETVLYAINNYGEEV